MIMSENQRKDETSKQKTGLEEQMISTTKDIEEQIHKLCRKKYKISISSE